VAEDRASGLWVIVASFLLALQLAVFPLPPSLAWLRPEWVLLVLVYWAIALPERVGLSTALLLGLVMDVAEGAVFGQHMLGIVVVTVLARLLYERLRVFTLPQQAVVLFLLVGTERLLCQWIQALEGVPARSAVFLLPAVTSALFWPPLFLLLRAVRRRFAVS